MNKYIITRENYDRDLTRMADKLAIDAANKIAATGKDRCEPVFCGLADGCQVSMSECPKCAHGESCIIRQFRMACLDAVTVAVCSVSDYYEKLEGGEA